MPTSCELNTRFDGASEIPDTVPVPLNGTVCGDPGALSANDKLADSAAASVGVKVTPISQKADAASVAPQVLDEMLKSGAFAPTVVIEVIVSVALPVFVSRVESGEEVELTG